MRKYRLTLNFVQIIEEHLDGFIDGLLVHACKVANRRQAVRLDSADISLVLRCLWDINIAGYAIPTPFPQLRGHVDHEKRLAAVNETRARVGEE